MRCAVLATIAAAQLCRKRPVQLGRRSLCIHGRRLTEYGFQEVETRYCTWLGGCAAPSRSWVKEPDRAEHMADSALKETLLYALDLDGYRSYLDISTKLYSDEKLLVLLHKGRARSKHIPAAARAESEQWLMEHNEGKGGD